MINLEAIDPEKVRHYLTQEGITPKPEKTEAAKQLATVYAAQRGEGIQMALCDICGCQGPSSLPECPFCGDGSDVVTDSVISCTKPDPQNELEAACRVVTDGLRIASQNLYNAGQAIIKIIDEQLWKQRIGEDGEPSYDGPYPCIEAECGVKHRAAKELVRVAREYDAKAFEDHGKTRLQVSLRLPKEKRKRFLEKAEILHLPKRGPEDRALARAMLQESEPEKDGDGGSFQEPPSNNSEQPYKYKPIPSTAGVRVRLGSTTIPMYRRPKTWDKTLEPAMTLKDYPWCDVHLGGDTYLGIRLTKDSKGCLVAILETKLVKRDDSGDGIPSIGI